MQEKHEYTKSVSRRRKDNKMAKGKRTKEQTRIYKKHTENHILNNTNPT